MTNGQREEYLKFQLQQSRVTINNMALQPNVTVRKYNNWRKSGSKSKIKLDAAKEDIEALQTRHTYQGKT